jgi:hypothetical protein
MNTEHEYIKFEDCKEGYLYKIDGRNFDLAIFHNNEFYGIRHKFNSEFIDHEIHWDKDDHYGTVKPLKELHKVPENVMTNLVDDCDDSEEIVVKHLKEIKLLIEIFEN